MTDSMQFGPEWLRNLSQQANENTMVIPKYQLAEHRYGREEMLALFDRSVTAPEPLRSISGLFVEKIQLPLALIQMSEEETRVWNSSVTTENNPRGLTKTMSNNLTSVNPISMNNSSSSTGLSRGRGTSVDRGRGRGVRGGTYHYNNRNFSEEGTDASHSNTAFGRPRIFDRSQSHNSERNWSERNGSAEYSDWNGYNNNAENGLSTSPRKDFGSAIRITSREDTNWRRRPGKDEDDSWRSSRHGRGYTNWREGGERDREKEKDLEGSESNKDRRWMSRVVSMHSQTNRRISENKENNLPEWATESPSEVGGSFDSSGAFHGLNSDEDEPIKEKEYEKPKKEPNRSNKRVDAINEISQIVDHDDTKIVNEPKKNKTKEKSPLVSKNAVKKIKDQEHSPLHECPPLLDNIENPTVVTDQLKSQQKQTLQEHLQQQQLQHLQQQTSPSLQLCKDIIQNRSDDYLNVKSNKEGVTDNNDTNRLSSQQICKSNDQDVISQSPSNQDYEKSSSDFDSGFSLNHCDAPSILGLNTTTYPDITSSSGSNLESKLLITPVDIVSSSISLMNQKDSVDKGFTLSTASVRPKEKEEELDGIVDDFVSKIMEEEKLEKIKGLENMNKWFYRDPQGIVQGPFSSTEMAEWYRLGYFHDKTLMVRRASENSYYPLQKLVSIYGHAPFENVTLQNINNYAPRLPLNVMGSGGIPPTNMTDDALLLSQPYQTPYDIQSLYARQQVLAANKRQPLSQAPDELKSLYEQQRLMPSHITNGADASSTVPPSAIPLVPGYMHPIIPTIPSNNHSLVLLLNQIQQQQQHQQLQQHLLQQRLQQQQQQQKSHQHQHSLQSVHQPQQHQQQAHKSPQPDVKSDRIQANLISHLEHPLQQLMHKVNNLSTSNQIPLVQSQGNSYLQSLPSDAVQPSTPPNVSADDNQPSNAIHNLLKQLGMSSEKQSKQVDSVWGPSNSPSVPILNDSTFNAQLWCSQVGRIGPSSSGSSGLWTTEGVPTTTAMKTEQQIIESFMKDMERKQDDGKKENETTSAKRRQEEDLIRKLMEESVKKKDKDTENKLDEEKKAKREEEKRKKRQEEEEKLRKIEEEQRKRSLEDAKRREEERRRKEEEKRRKEEEKEHKRKLEEEKRQEQKRKEAEDTQRKQTNAVRRLKEQQATVTVNDKSKSATFTETSDQQPKVQKLNSNVNNNNKQLLKSQSGSVEDTKKLSSDFNRATVNEDRLVSKQIAKSKSTPSVPTQGQKTSDLEKKDKKKKEKNIATVSAWPDQKKITNVKSLAEIQAEEQKQLAKQIEKERSERLLQQQQAAAAAQATKEAANVNIWNSQNQPWKTNSTWTSAVSSSSSNSFTNKTELPAITKTWNEHNRVTAPTVAGNSVNKHQPTTANSAAATAANKCAPSNTNAVMKNISTAKNKQKKEDATGKKSASLTLAIPKNDELSKWGVKALSSLKPSVDVPTFIAFLREVESPNDVMEYVTDYLGDGKEIKSFVKQFLEKRSVLMPGLSASVTVSTTVVSTVSGTSASKKNKKKSDEISPNTTKASVKQPASKQNSLEFTEVKGKMKKGKKKPMLRLDSAFLGFNVTAAPDRINVGDRDYVEDLY